MSETMSDKISKGLLESVMSVAKSRDEYYTTNPIPLLDSMDSIIQSYSYKNATISGGAGIIPGPWGMAAAVPEMVAVLRNQIAMIYDIAKINGQKEIPSELIVGVLFGASGQGAASLIIIQGQKVMAKRVGAQALQKIVAILGGKITQQVAKSMAAKWIPVAGAIAMATWSKYTTNEIGQKAKEIFSKEIVFESQEINIEILENSENENSNIQALIEKSKIECFIKLMKIDGRIDDNEVQFVTDFINKCTLTSESKLELVSKISDESKIEINYALFQNNKEEALYLLIDLIALAKVDEKFHITEKLFIKEIGKTLGFSESEISELIE